MENEQSNLSSVSGENVSELPVIVSDESFLGQNENPVEDSYVVENGGEIMVEIVGSDVFLDGMRPNRVVSRDLEVKCSESVAISSRGDEMVDDNSASPNHGATELVEDPVEASVVGETEIGGIEVDTDMRETKDDVTDDNSANANHGGTELVEAAVVGEIGGIEVDTDVRETKDDAVDGKGVPNHDKGVPDHVDDSVKAVTEGESSVGMMVTEESAIESEGADKNSSNYQNIDTSQVKVVNDNKSSKTGEGIDTELIEVVLEGQGTATELVKDTVEASVVGEREIGGIEMDTDMRETKDDDVDDKGVPDHVNDSVEAVTEAQGGIDTELIEVVLEGQGTATELVKDTVEASVVGEREIGGIEVDTDMRETKDDDVDDKGVPDHVNDSVEAVTEAQGKSSVGVMVTEKSAIESEGAENNCLNDENIEIPQVKVVDVDKPRENGEGIDTELIEELVECQETFTIQELDAPTGNVSFSPNDVENLAAEDNSVVSAEIGVDTFVEESRSPQNKELEVSLQKNEEEHDDVDMSESVQMPASNDEINKSGEFEEDSSKYHENHSSETRLVDVEMETELYQKYHQEDSSKSHDNRFSETRLMDVGTETELHQEYHQEEEVDAETGQLSDEVVSSRKRKALDPLTDGPDERANFNAANVSASTDQNPKPSFKIGECILRVASQLTGGTSVVVNEISADSSSVIDMLSQFQIVAQGPSKPHEFRDEILAFFSGFRSSVVANKRVRRKKSDKSVGGSAEDFEFDDAKDSYWTDMIVQNSPEKPTLHNNENGQGRLQLAAPVNGEKPEKSGRKPQSRKKRYFTGHIPNTPKEFEDKAKRMNVMTSPAELILNFAERKCVPSEINLNKMFRRFGPLMESETEVDYESGQARVIFKKGSDAEIALNSAQKFSIFGPVLVNYQIGYSPLISVKISPLTIP